MGARKAGSGPMDNQVPAKAEVAGAPSTKRNVPVLKDVEPMDSRTAP